MIAFDTLSWAKIFRLYEKHGLRVKFEESEVLLTHSLHKELVYFYPDRREFFEKFPVLPIIGDVYRELVNLGFDPADASLLEYAIERDIIIITEDRDMLSYGYIKRLKVMQLADFIVYTAISGDSKINDAMKAIRILRRMENITKRKYRRLTKILKQIS